MAANNPTQPKDGEPRAPAVLLDRDGVLNKSPGPGNYLLSWEEWKWLPGAQEALGLFYEAGYQVVILTNQSGIAQGLMTEDALEDIHRKMKASTKSVGGENIAIYHCPHVQANGCECRKPKPGMLLQAQRDLGFDLERTYFIGDDERDMQAGEAAGCRSILVSNETSLLDVTRQILSGALPL